MSLIISTAVLLSTRNTTRHKFSHLLSSDFTSSALSFQDFLRIIETFLLFSVVKHFYVKTTVFFYVFDFLFYAFSLHSVFVSIILEIVGCPSSFLHNFLLPPQLDFPAPSALSTAYSTVYRKVCIISMVPPTYKPHQRKTCMHVIQYNKILSHSFHPHFSVFTVWAQRCFKSLLIQTHHILLLVAHVQLSKYRFSFIVNKSQEPKCMCRCG